LGFIERRRTAVATFTFTAPDGTTLQRTSKTRTYTHAVIFKRDGKWVMGSCVGRPDLLADRLEYWGRGSPDCIAVPANAN
jgi:hypothetical protein